MAEMPTFEIAINAHENLRTRAALAAMTGILAGTGLGIARSRLPRPDQVANMAVDYADALIAALKEAPDGTQ